MAKMLTETEALAICLARELDGAKSLGADQCERATLKATELFIAKNIDAATLGRVNARLGNHSALRQWAIRQGLLPASDAPEDALAKAVRAVIAKGDKALAEMTKE